MSIPPEPTEAVSTLELSEAQFIALAETDRAAALKLMWPEAQDADTMRFLDDIIFDGFIASLKAKQAGGPQTEALSEAFTDDPDC